MGAILLAWVAVLAWHVRRQYFRPLTVRLAEASANLVPVASYYAVKLGDATIGYAASRIDTVPDGFTLLDDLRLRVNALGSDAPVSARTTVNLGERLELKDFRFDLRSDFGNFEVNGAMVGDTALDLAINAGGDEQSMVLPTGGPVLLPQVMPMHFALGEEPKPGDRFVFEVFDPSVLERQEVTLEVVEGETLIVPDSADYDEASESWVAVRYDTVETWHVRQGFGGLELDAWLDPDGQVVKATSPLGYTIERTAFEIAWNRYRALETTAARAVTPDIIENTAISVGVDLPEGGRVGRLAVRLLNVELEGFDLEGERQRLRGDTLFVESEPELPSASYSLPADADEFGAALQATPLIQAGDPEIQRAVEEVLDGVTDPRRAARLLSEWVYSTLDKRITMSVPSARQVLEARSGDCNEHTVLYVAMARAAGLPARAAAGLVYVRDRFYYHAWPEVWLDGWVPVDPTLGQTPADASHLRFVVGGLARQVELVRLIGLLRLDVVSVEER
jgi:transglutaminase-like putative cysteine protease